MRSVPYHSCQTETDVGGRFLRTDTGVSLIGDIITATHFLVLAEM